MRKIHSLIVLSLAAVILQPGLGGAAPDRGVELRWEAVSDQHVSKLWIRNLSARSAEATLEAASSSGSVAGSEVVSVEAGKAVEVSAARLGGTRELRLRSEAELFVLQIPESFDPAATEIEGPPAYRRVRGKKGVPPQVIRPDWAQDLLAGRPNLPAGSTGSAAVTSEHPEAKVELAVEFLQADSSVRVRLLDTRGEVTELVATSSKPVRWRTVLGPVNGESRVEIQVQRGEAHATVAAVNPGTNNVERTSVVVKSTPPGGSGYFNHEINWWHTSDLYYSVAGAPPNTWGTVWTLRNNGSWTATPNWILTDSNGNATKGPWSYANQPGDEDALAYIQWANGTETNWSHHIWDKTEPSVDFDNLYWPPGARAPSHFSGSAWDGPFGAGFDARWADCKVSFYNRSTGFYWTPSVGSYNANSNYELPCTIFGMPSRSVTWDTPWYNLPPSSAHTVGHCYRWKACLYDGGKWGCWDLYFCS